MKNKSFDEEYIIEFMMHKHLFDLNNEETRSKIYRFAEMVLDTSKSNDNILEYNLQCDENNNTQDVISSNKLVLDTYVKYYDGNERNRRYEILNKSGVNIN